MRVKTFQGRSLEEILPDIRSELGDEAVVISQRQLVAGGMGGFFGKRMIEVTAADQMPSDAELIALEDRAHGDGGEDAPSQQERFVRAQFSPPTASRVDLTDDWDPSQDVELAPEYGGITGAVPPKVQPAALAAYQPLELPQRSATVSPQMLDPQQQQQMPAAAAQAQTFEDQVDLELPHSQDPPQEQARKLAARAHHAIAEATREIEQQLAYSRAQRPPLSAHTFRADVSTPPQAPIGFPTPEELLADTSAHQADNYLIEPVGSPDGGRDSVTRRAPLAPDHELIRDARALEQELQNTGVDVDIAQDIISRVVSHRRPFAPNQALRSLAREVVGEIVRVETGWAPIGRAHRVAMVGASGAGKSSTIAKIAAGYTQMAGYSVGVISIVSPSEPLSQHELRTDPLLRRNDIDVRMVTSPEQMGMVLDRLRESDLILIDTPSAAYLDEQAFAHVAACLAAAGVDEVHVVVPLATSTREAESVIEHFRGMNVNRLVVSKLDESRYAGQLMNFGFRFGLPITFLSDGPSVPEDLRAASAAEIAALILPDEQ